MAYTLNQEKNFTRQVTEACHKPALAALALILAYTFLFVPSGSISSTLITLSETLGISGLTFCLVNYFCLPRDYALFAQGITDSLEEKESMTDQERTALVLKIMSLPIKLCVSMVCWLMVVAAAISACFYYLLDMDLVRACCLLVPYFFGSFFSSLTVYTRVEAYCTEETRKLMLLGIDDDMVRKQKVFGMRLTIRLIYHIVLPVVSSICTILLYIWLNHPKGGSPNMYLFGGMVLIQLSLLECGIAANAFKNHTVEEIKEVNTILETVAEGNVETVLQLPVDLGTELSFTFYRINRLMVTLQERQVASRKRQRKLSEALANLSEMHQKSMSAITSHSSAVENQMQLLQRLQETFSTLQDLQNNTDALGNRILAAIENGRGLMAENTSQLEFISEANIETITGIKKVSDQIDSVWHYISVIDDIAEKNRTIAFNTEIESTATGENAENFHIIAAEIRRLAASITESTREIRNRITDIQHSTDNLIITSEGGTEKIREESELFTQVEDSFEALALSGKVADESYETISDLIRHEVSLEQKLYESFSQYSACYTQLTQKMQTAGSATAICQLLVQEEKRD